MVVDTYYTDVFRAFPLNPAGTYASELRALLDRSFGTADFWSRGLTALGWEVQDIIANNHALQYLWSQESGWHGDPLSAQVSLFNPDVLFMQDLGWSVNKPEGCILAGQCSCPMPEEKLIRQFDVIFTSFPHYVKRFEDMGVRAVYNPLAFDPIVLDRCRQFEDRPYDVVFVGGVGVPSHWQQGMRTLEAVARAIPTFKWWGYGADLLPEESILRDRYMGTAFGTDMYEIYLQSLIVINRHGEIAQGYANNMRMFEATGCGALLLTEAAPNLSDFFTGNECVSYRDADEAIGLIRDLLGSHKKERKWIARNGQKRTLQYHTYAKRMEVVSSVLTEMLGANNTQTSNRSSVPC